MLSKKDKKKVSKWRERIRKKYHYLKLWQEKHDILPTVFCNMTALAPGKMPSKKFVDWVEYILKSEGL